MSNKIVIVKRVTEIGRGVLSYAKARLKDRNITVPNLAKRLEVTEEQVQNILSCNDLGSVLIDKLISVLEIEVQVIPDTVRKMDTESEVIEILTHIVKSKGDKK